MRSASRWKKPSASTSRMTVAFGGRLVTCHQSITVAPMVSSDSHSTDTFTSRPLNRSGLMSHATTQGSCSGPPSVPCLFSSKRSKKSSIAATAGPDLFGILRKASTRFAVVSA